MANGREGEGFFAIPHAAVYALIAANIIIFALVARQSGGEALSGELLFANGAMYAGALDRHEYWRLIAYGFLHANLLHLATNMLCLALWGAHLERRLDVPRAGCRVSRAIAAGSDVRRDVRRALQARVSSDGMRAV